MGTYSIALITKNIYDSGLDFFTLKTLKDILQVKKESTTFDIIKRLIKNKVLSKVEKNKYVLQNSKIDDFSLANFVYNPSYISFETALNLHGILSQFPYETTSATVKKTKQKIINDKVFSFTHLKKDLFWGYEKKKDFLIAFPEKALLDQIYIASKGLKGVSFDEYDFSFINLKRFKSYINKFPKTRQLNKMIEKVKKYIKFERDSF